MTSGQSWISRFCNVVINCSPSGRDASPVQLKMLRLLSAERCCKPFGKDTRFEQCIIVRRSRAVACCIRLGWEAKLWQFSMESDRSELNPSRLSSGRETILGQSVISMDTRKVRFVKPCGIECSSYQPNFRTHRRCSLQNPFLGYGELSAAAIPQVRGGFGNSCSSLTQVVSECRGRVDSSNLETQFLDSHLQTTLSWSLESTLWDASIPQFLSLLFRRIFCVRGRRRRIVHVWNSPTLAWDDPFQFGSWSFGIP